MKRDMDLIRKLVFIVEESNDELVSDYVQAEGYGPEEISYPWGRLRIRLSCTCDAVAGGKITGLDQNVKCFHKTPIQMLPKLLPLSFIELRRQSN